MTAPRIVVIVLNWNGKADTLQCLESLANLSYSNFETLVVDNGSQDGSVPAIRERFPGTKLIETGKNLGYAEGNNVGIVAALESGCDFVLLLNNDTVVDPILLTEFVKAAEERSDAGVFGAKIYRYTERDIWYAGARWHPEFLRFEVVVDELEYGDAMGRLVETDYACGCALFVRRSVLENIGLLEPSFFLTYEEVDFCFRARRAGFAVLYVPRAIVWHKVSVSFGGAESPLMSYFMTRNYLLWTERNLTRAQSRAARVLALRRLKWNLLPKFPGTRDWRMMSPVSLVQAIVKYVADARELWAKPSNRGMFWGTAHYFMRRFGPAPDFVRQLGRP